MVADSSFIAVDWGTSNRRAFFVGDDGGALAREHDTRGVRAIAPGGFAAEAAGLCARLGDLPLLCAGMIGSSLGWREAPHFTITRDAKSAGRRACPGRGRNLHRARRLRSAWRRDARRGGAVPRRACRWLGPPDTLLCQPGTHSKWARLKGARLTGFASAMTGELFALMREASVLAEFMPGDAAPGEAFDEGVRMASLATSSAGC